MLPLKWRPFWWDRTARGLSRFRLGCDSLLRQRIWANIWIMVCRPFYVRLSHLICPMLFPSSFGYQFNPAGTETKYSRSKLWLLMPWLLTSSSHHQSEHCRCRINEYRQVFDIRRTIIPLNCWSLRCSWSIACRRCSNYIFILHLTLGFSILRKDNCKPRRKTFKFWNLVRLIFTVLVVQTEGVQPPASSQRREMKKRNANIFSFFIKHKGLKF